MSFLAATSPPPQQTRSQPASGGHLLKNTLLPSAIGECVQKHTDDSHKQFPCRALDSPMGVTSCTKHEKNILLQPGYRLGFNFDVFYFKLYMENDPKLLGRLMEITLGRGYSKYLYRIFLNEKQNNCLNKIPSPKLHGCYGIVSNLLVEHLSYLLTISANISQNEFCPLIRSQPLELFHCF